ncbi:MAG: hypothetical protein JSU98_06245 [Gemmatimonadales bacterium]|jgi:hypothetical protein|nr:MAG: hypothetical protein JSU98_06245 [Gemmatimonadales bacterium]
MKKKTMGRLLKVGLMMKAPKLTYLLRHPIRGPRNLLALRGAKSLLKTRGAAVTGAALATAAVALPLAAVVRKDHAE